MHLMPRRASAACAALLLCGCADLPPHVMFMTKASLGVDVETTAQTASLAYDRVEGYSAPRYAGQEVAPVYASFATNGQMINRTVKQLYATGGAAETLSKPIPVMFRSNGAGEAPANFVAAGGLPSPRAAPAETKPKAMFFGTGTVLGFKIGFGPTSLDSFTLGFKRKELSIIPQDEKDGKFPSVMASFDTDLATESVTTSKLAINQFFATGVAADALALNPEIHGKFEEKAVTMMGQFRADESEQRRYALLSLYCLSKLDETQSARVWKNVADLKLFDAAGITDLNGAATDAAKRTVYARELTLTKGDSKTQTGLMTGHHAYVCDLTKKS